MGQTDTWQPPHIDAALIEQFGAGTLLKINGIDLEVFSFGQDNGGKPLVLCHGWPEHAFSWRHQIEPLVAMGYHVIVPNQRGYGASSRSSEVIDYDITKLAGDLVGLLDHYQYDDAVFVGHDWGAIIVWNLAMLHPTRVAGVINLSVPFMERGPTEWIEFWDTHLGGDFYIVHFNQQPGVADQIFADHCEQFLRNMYRTNQWQHPAVDLGEGMAIANMATREDMPGDVMMSEPELRVFIDSFKRSGFTGGINWYRNFTRNWHILGEYEQQITQPTLMIYGDYDSVPASDKLSEFVPDLEVVNLDCGHWIQQERPAETNAALKSWLDRRYTN